MAYQPGLSEGISAKRDDLNPYCLTRVDYYSPEQLQATRGYSNRAGLSTERRYALHDGRFLSNVVLHPVNFAWKPRIRLILLKDCATISIIEGGVSYFTKRTP